MIELRPYQKQGIAEIFAEWRNGKKSVLFQMPTGTGKTTLFAQIVNKANEKNKKVLLIVHRIELVVQIWERLQLFGITAGVIASGNPVSLFPVQVATIQTLSNRVPPEADLIIIDEAHHSTASTYTKLWEIYPNAHILGVTATPIRLNGKGFENLFDVLICSAQIKWFIEEKYLSNAKQFACSIPHLERVKISKGDYNESQLEEVMSESGIMADLIESYQKYANGKKTIVFAVNISHSKLIEQKYKEAGINCRHLDAETPKEIRRNILEGFRNGSISVLTNVNIVSEGFDVPDCEAVQMARPTKSLAMYLQQAGRALRPMENKEFAVILDNANNWKEHGVVTADRIWKLEGSKLKKKNAFIYIDKEGVAKEANNPEELKGMELTEITEELSNLVKFEEFIVKAKSFGWKGVSAYYKYLDIRNSNITKNEFFYMKNRLSKLFPFNPKPKFFDYEAKKFGFSDNENNMSLSA